MKNLNLYDLRLGILNGVMTVFRPFFRLYAAVALHIWMIQLTLEWKSKKRATLGTSIRGTMGTWLGASSPPDFSSTQKTTSPLERSILLMTPSTQSLDTETCSSMTTFQKTSIGLRRIKASGEFC